jgi:hypothetical protein
MLRDNCSPAPIVEACKDILKTLHRHMRILCGPVSVGKFETVINTSP